MAVIFSLRTLPPCLIMYIIFAIYIIYTVCNVHRHIYIYMYNVSIQQGVFYSDISIQIPDSNVIKYKYIAISYYN